MTHTTNPSKSVPERSSLLYNFPAVSPLLLLVHCKQPRSKSVVRIQQLLIVANFAYHGKYLTLQSRCLCPFWLVFYVQGSGLKQSLQSLAGNGGCVQKSLKGSSFVVICQKAFGDARGKIILLYFFLGGLSLRTSVQKPSIGPLVRYSFL